MKIHKTSRQARNVDGYWGTLWGFEITHGSQIIWSGRDFLTEASRDEAIKVAMRNLTVGDLTSSAIGRK